MGDRHHRPRILLEELLEPGHRLRVEVVGRLVEQEHVVGLQQQAAQCDAAALAAAQRAHVRIPGRDAQRVHRRLDVAVQLPEVLGVDLVLEPAQLVRVLVGPVRGEVLVFLEDRALWRHRLLDDLEDGLLRIELRLLGEEPDARAVGGKSLAREVLVHAGHDPEERALARPVAPEHADLGRRVEREPDALEDLLALLSDLAEVLHREDVLRCHVRIILNAGGAPVQPECAPYALRATPMPLTAE